MDTSRRKQTFHPLASDDADGVRGAMNNVLSLSHTQISPNHVEQSVFFPKLWTNMDQHGPTFLNQPSLDLWLTEIHLQLWPRCPHRAPQSILYVNMFVRIPKHSLMQRIVRCISLPCIEFLINIHTSG